MKNTILKTYFVSLSIFMIVGCGGEDSTENATSKYFLASGNTDGSSPVANIALLDKKVTEGNSITLDARESSDKNGAIVSYKWTLLESNAIIGEGEVLEYDTSKLQNGTHSIHLEVTDDTSNTDSANIVFTVIHTKE